MLLSLAVDKTVGDVGDVFNFTGKLSLNGEIFQWAVPIQWLCNGTVFGETTTNPETGDFANSWVAPEPGTYVFYARARTPAIIDSNRVTVTVREEEEVEVKKLPVPLIVGGLAVTLILSGIVLIVSKARRF